MSRTGTQSTASRHFVCLPSTHVLRLTMGLERPNGYQTSFPPFRCKYKPLARQIERTRANAKMEPSTVRQHFPLDLFSYRLIATWFYEIDKIKSTAESQGRPGNNILWKLYHLCWSLSRTFQSIIIAANMAGSIRRQAKQEFSSVVLPPVVESIANDYTTSSA